MPEIVGTFARTELWDERANCSSEARNSSRRDLTEERLEFAVRQFDWIEVGRVFRQVAQRRVRFLNRLANGGPHVDAAVIHHDDVVAPERGNQALLDIGEEHLSSHGTFDQHWGGHFVVAQGSNEGDRLPCSKRNGADHTVAARRPPPDPHQVCADRGLVDKHQPGGIKHALLSDPTSACSRHIRSLPFGSLQADSADPQSPLAAPGELRTLPVGASLLSRFAPARLKCRNFWRDTNLQKRPAALWGTQAIRADL